MGDEESLGDTTGEDAESDCDPARYIARLYFIALSEWGLTPTYVNHKWTPEILWLMFRERREEIRHIKAQQLHPDRAEEPGAVNGHSRRVSDMELFEKMKINPNPKA